ncbi:protein phosphatase 2C domain-containing protein [Streptomyces sp. NPDC127033]|uniref:protein phosphatase 2C domain-containing protein n=1 Tax=Streptomyces sp. NPDC127033 TaxID=3347110 RepID=UPI003669636F
MSEQGERPPDDDWWNRLYDASAPDTGPAAKSGDTLDDRFDSAADAVRAGTTPDPGRPMAGPDPAADPRPAAGPAGGATAAPADPPPAPAAEEAGDRAGDSTGPARAWWEQAPSPAPYAPSDARPLPRTDARDAVPPEAPRGPGLGGDAVSPGAPRGWSSGMDAVPPEAPRGWSSGMGAVPPEAPPPPAPKSAPPPPTQGPPPAAPPTPGPSSPAPPPPPPPANAPGARAVPDPRAAPGSTPVPAPDRARGAPRGDRPPGPGALPAAHPDRLAELVADTVLDGASYGSYTLRAVSVRGDAARYRGEPRRDALLTARFGTGPGALVLVAVAGGARGAEEAHRAAAEICHWIGGAVGRDHSKLSEDIRAGRRGELKSGLHRLTDRGFGRLRARAAERGLAPEAYTASLRCLLLTADPDCRNRVFFGAGAGGLFRLRDGGWEDLEPSAGASATAGSPPAETPEGDRLTMDLAITNDRAPYIEGPPPPPPEPFLFRASVARPGDTLLLCSAGLAEPLRAEPALAAELARRWDAPEPPGPAGFLVDTALGVRGHTDDRTAVAVWEA